MAPGHLPPTCGSLFAPGNSIHRLLFLHDNLREPSAKALSAGGSPNPASPWRWAYHSGAMSPTATRSFLTPTYPLGGPWQSGYK